MPKQSTKEIQDAVQKLGERLGFISVVEERIHSHTAYAPVYDVVWYLDTTGFFDTDALALLFKNAPELMAQIKKLPVAGFEIEGAATSSKNQLGNFANLYSGNFLFNFVIVNNNAAKNENDTYRRGRKLYRYFNEEIGSRNTVFMDCVHLNKSIESLKCCDSTVSAEKTPVEARRSFGGDTTSIEMYDAILPYIAASGFEIKQNYSPVLPYIKHKLITKALAGTDSEMLNFYLGRFFHKYPENPEKSVSSKVTDMFYIPKIDVVLGFNLQKGFYCWLRELATALGDDAVVFPMLYGVGEKIIGDIFVPLVGIEFESSINKHCNGGIINMHHYTHTGVLISSIDSKSHIDFMRHQLGINNVTHLSIGEIK